MKAAAAIASILKAEGTEYLFCFPINALIDECARIGIRPIVARTERTLLNMADGYSRVSQRPAHRRGRGAARAGRGERLRRRRPGLRGRLAAAVPPRRQRGGARRPSAQLRRRRAATGPSPSGPPASTRPRRVPALMRRAFTLLRSGRPGPGAAGSAGRRCRRRGGAVRLPPGPAPARRRRPRRRPRGGAHPARRPPAAAARRPGRAVGGGLGRAARVRRAAPGPGDDHAARQERLPGEPPAVGRHGRLLRHGDGRPFPAAGRRHLRHRLQLHRHHLRGADPAGEGRHPRSPTTRPTSTRTSRPTWPSWATPSWSCGS